MSEEAENGVAGRVVDLDGLARHLRSEWRAIEGHTDNPADPLSRRWVRIADAAVQWMLFSEDGEEQGDVVREASAQSP